MKKKIFGGIAVIAIAAAMALNLNFSTNNNKLSNISLANIEALARTDVGSCTGPKIESSQGSLYCQCTNSNPCADNYGCN